VSSSSSSSSSSVESKNSALFQLALAYQAQGSLDQAVKIYEEVIKVDNDHHDDWCE
jgi:tetratricopeptide (TPR) repeat protein